MPFLKYPLKASAIAGALLFQYKTFNSFWPKFL